MVTNDRQLNSFQVTRKPFEKADHRSGSLFRYGIKKWKDKQLYFILSGHKYDGFQCRWSNINETK